MGRSVAMAGFDYGDAASKFWPMVSGIGIASWALIRARNARIELTEKAKKALESIATDAVGKVIAIQIKQIDAQEKRIDELEFEMQGLQAKHSEMMASKDAEITLLRGECREAMTIAHSYEKLLTENKIPHEQPIRPFWDVSGNELRPIRI